MKLPDDFEKRMRLQLGTEAYLEFEAALSQPAPVSLRVNPNKYPHEPVLEKIPWCSTGYYLPERPAFSSDPLWHAGAYYVQEASSMMLEKAFLEASSRLTGPLKVLDLCASPGGKSTHLASLLGAGDILVSNEVIRSRLAVLHENILKHGYPNIIITCADSNDFGELGEVFDIVLVDAPCSGEGLFRKDSQAVNEWSPENVRTCELRQNRILENTARCLKTGGFIIYSTCTYNPGENAVQVAKLTGMGFEPVEFHAIEKQAHEFQCYPHEVKGEGFYISLLRKTGADGSTLKKSRKSSLKVLKPVSEINDLLMGDFSFYEFGEQVLALNDGLIEFYRSSVSNLYCYAAGIKVCRQKDHSFYPSEYLPFSAAFNRNHFPEISLEQQEALAYLSNNSLAHKGNEKGFTVLKYNDIPLGLGKFAGNRINNLFPNEWKLRKPVPKEAWFTLSNY
jgi:16S rRNA C967 or C1407 C5-methylase (RsmB/RsmF family)/NOL1/NOP2/fmu family ribosome biogenesis protein